MINMVDYMLVSLATCQDKLVKIKYNKKYISDVIIKNNLREREHLRPTGLFCRRSVCLELTIPVEFRDPELA